MNNPNTSKQAVSQFNADARLLAEFEHSENDSGKAFNYKDSVLSSAEIVHEEQITAYLSKIQRGGFIQSFGCLLAIEEPSFRILAYSENTSDLLGLNASVESTKFEDCLLGYDARTLFTKSSAASLTKVVSSQDISLSNPVSVVSESAQIHFLAILHRVDVGIIIDLEPIIQRDPAFSVEGALQAQKLALCAISRLQSFPRGDIGALCDALVEDVRELIGYDRVMVYKFHEDEHGEVVAEIRRSDLEPYLGLHYPAIDVPQAARFLFKKNRVRMICDFRSTNVSIIQSEELEQPLMLVNSTLRAPHACHIQYMANMGSGASLVMAIIVNENDSMKLWGLVSCHHLTPRYIPFPIRDACEFILQAFGVQLSMEQQFILHSAEKKIQKTHALLCDMILKDVPFGIITRSPNIMDLVNCNGAAFSYDGVCRVLGVTPTELQIKNIINWLIENDKQLVVWSTNSLADTDYPNASTLGEVVCGMVSARITSKDFLFWFRSGAKQEIRWGGAKHHHKDKDDDKNMHPRSSFQAFLEVVKNKSLPWEAWEIKAIHSLQDAMEKSFQEMENDSTRITIPDNKNDLEIKELTLVAKEMDRLFEMAVVPIFAVDSLGNINRWNSKISELTGLSASSAMGKCLLNEFVHDESHESFEHNLSRALQGEEDKNIELRLKTMGQKEQDSIFIKTNACSCKDNIGNVVGVCFVGQDVTEVRVIMDMFVRLREDYKAITESVNPLIPSIFVADENARCSEWNASMEKLTGWGRNEVIGKMLAGEIFGKFCRLKSQDDVTKLMIFLYQTLCSQDDEKYPFAFFDREGILVEAVLTTNKRIDMDGHVVGCFCFLQTVRDTRHNLSETNYSSGSKGFEYIRQEIKNSMRGIRFTHKLLESTQVSNDQKQLLQMSDACERQMLAILETTNIGSIEDGCQELNMVVFLLENVINAVISQVMISLVEKDLHLMHEISKEIGSLSLYGDQIRLQQILSDFLMHVVHHTQSSERRVEVRVDLISKLIRDGHDFVHLQFRMIHPGEGLPLQIVQEMFQTENKLVSQGGFGLRAARKILRNMNGHVQYIREPSRCYFLIDIEFQTTEGTSMESVGSSNTISMSSHSES